MTTTIEKFNLRVYGLLIHDDSILISHERRSGLEMVKFPGGGIEKGEGVEEALRREFKEELNLPIRTIELFYVNEFLQVSAFNPKDQLISFYYLVNIDDSIVETHFSFQNDSFEYADHLFKWKKLKEMSMSDFTFPIDQKVVNLIVEMF